MSLQTVALSEGSFTDGALVWSLSAVRPHVDRQIRLASTSFPTNPADVRFDARVDFHVHGEVAHAVEAQAAL